MSRRPAPSRWPSFPRAAAAALALSALLCGRGSFAAVDGPAPSTSTETASETATPAATATRTPTSTATISAASNCCAGHGGRGCDRASCQSCVCAADVFCCVVTWDAECAAQALGACAVECPCVSAGARGTIRYFQGARPVGSVSVHAGGKGTATSTDGTYDVPDLEPGTLQIVPSKLGDLRGAISSLDAAFATQSSIGLRTLTADQRLACDVTGNGTVSSLDAAKIVQLVLGAIPRLPVASLCSSDWAFIPDALAAPHQEVIPPHVGAGVCTAGAIRFDPLAGKVAGQDFRAVLFGDCTGSWQP
jgi:hypothetical protein